jgi:hypothetical protein
MKLSYANNSDIILDEAELTRALAVLLDIDLAEIGKIVDYPLPFQRPAVTRRQPHH